MKECKNKLLFGLLLLCASVIVYIIHLAIFEDLHHILVFAIEDLAFVFIEVLLVSLIIEGFLERREKQRLMEKLNMLIGLFFSQLGLKLLRSFVIADENVVNIKKHVFITDEWKESDFKKTTDRILKYDYSISIDKINLEELKIFLNYQRDFLIRIMQNPSLLEHETFTELLSAVFHLQEELNFRTNVSSISDENKEHIKNDIIRVYKLLAYEWIIYMKYLKEEYPFMFVTAKMNNPYNDDNNISDNRINNCINYNKE